MSNSLWFSRIFTLQSFRWFCFNYSFWLFLRCTWKNITTKVRNFFYNHWIWKFSVSHFKKFIDFKITTNSFIYSLVEQFLKLIFTKIITGVRGILLGKTWQNFQVYIPPYLGCGEYNTSNIRRYEWKCKKLWNGISL